MIAPNEALKEDSIKIHRDHALIDINLDNVARKLNMEPLEFRLKNLVHPYDKDPTGGPDLL